MKTTLASLAFAALAGCAVQLPPPATPAKIMPQAPPPPGPPAQGMGQVTLDTVAEPASVDAITGFTEFSLRHGDVVGVNVQPVCPSTPCVADLPLGTRQLIFSSIGDPNHSATATVSVGAQPSVFRGALGHNDPHTAQLTGGALASGFGFMLASSGLVLHFVGSSTDPVTHAPRSEGLSHAGNGLLIAGGALLVAGIVLMATGAPEYQQGTGIQWTPAASDAAAR
jgi:hypothetical protein